MEQIAIYLRLSKEDEFVKDESNSITNQRVFIRGFINKNKELRKMSVMEFVDDGYSGKNMDRPMKDMQETLKVIRKADKDFKVSLAGTYHKELLDDLNDYCITIAEKFTPEEIEARHHAGEST